MASNMVGKMFKIAIGTKDSLKNCNKMLHRVNCYIDRESGTLYIIPAEESNDEENIFLKDI